MEMKQRILSGVVIPRNGGKWMFQNHRRRECAPVSAWRGGTAPPAHAGNSGEASILLGGSCILGQGRYTAQEASGWTCRENWAGESRFGQDLGVTAEREELP